MQPGSPPHRSLTVRRACNAEVSDVCGVHAAAFPAFYLTRLGPRFLREYYLAVLAYPSGVLLVAVNESRIVGFASGFSDPVSFYRFLLRRGHKFLLPLAIAATTSPWFIGSIFRKGIRLMHRSFCRPDASEPVDMRLRESCWELSSLAVHPEAQGCGHGTILVAHFLSIAAQSMADCVTLSTDAVGNESANRFYTAQGFTCIGPTESSGGRVMNKYAYIMERPHDTFHH